MGTMREEVLPRLQFLLLLNKPDLAARRLVGFDRNNTKQPGESRDDGGKKTDGILGEPVPRIGQWVTLIAFCGGILGGILYLGRK